DDEGDAQVGAGEGRAGVEPEPSEGEDEATDDRHRQVMPRDRLWFAVDVLADARSDDDRSRQRDHASHCVHDPGTGKVNRAMSKVPVDSALGEEPASPDPVRVYAIRQRDPQ